MSKEWLPPNWIFNLRDFSTFGVSMSTFYLFWRWEVWRRFLLAKFASLFGWNKSSQHASLVRRHLDDHGLDKTVFVRLQDSSLWLPDRNYANVAICSSLGLLRAFVIATRPIDLLGEVSNNRFGRWLRKNFKQLTNKSAERAFFLLFWVG